jgi:RNA polymerase sigma-54 factor
MKQSIQLRLGQHLTMTPQLQQAIRLLQLSMLDLRQEIQEALDSNLMLEDADEADERMPPEAGEEGSAQTQERGNSESDQDRELAPEDTRIPDELPMDSEWTDLFDGHAPSGPVGDGEEFDPFAQKSRPLTLHDHLHWQLNLSRLGPTDIAVAEAIIDAIDTDGYLGTDTDELLEMLDDAELTREEIEAVLHRVQSFDPPGVGARNLRECLLIQLRQLPEGAPEREHAIAVCETCFDALSKSDTAQIRRQLGLPDEAVADALALIRSLNPRPGALIEAIQPEYVIPDVFVRKREGRWTIELNPDTVPRLRVNPVYAKLIRRADHSEANACMKTHLQEARWFIKSLVSRNDTVLRVAGKIVELQRDFLEFGAEAMKPMILRDIADALELHESTVSRVTTQKYMHTPRGTFEFKYFFSSRVGTTSGGECSSTAIRAVIRKLVAAESPGKPLSDSKLAAVLEDQGVQVARRTVAKYRESLGIPPSNERRRPM